MSTKRPRTELSLCKKYDIVKELNGGAKQADVAKKYGINESTVSRIKKERQSISKKFETGEKNPKQKRNRNIGFADVDQALYNWVVSTDGVRMLPSILDKFPMENIFNVDETALFWKLLPNCTHMVKGQKFSGGKRSKELS